MTVHTLASWGYPKIVTGHIILAVDLTRLTACVFEVCGWNLGQEQGEGLHCGLNYPTKPINSPKCLACCKNIILLTVDSVIRAIYMNSLVYL